MINQEGLVKISADFGIILRRAALSERNVARERVIIAMEDEPLAESMDLLSFGPHFGGEAADEFVRRLQALGLELFDDFFVFQGDFPTWCSFFGGIQEDNQ